jgi:phage terminase large subunit
MTTTDAVNATVQRAADDPPQYSWQRIAGVWALATAPMALAAWVAAPALAEQWDDGLGLLRGLVIALTLGGRGMRADATAIWIAQFIGKTIHVLDYYEAVGQPLSAHIAWMRSRHYDKAICVLPHDGAPVDPVADVSWESELRAAGFDVPAPVANQGPGAARLRIEAARKLFPRIWFNEATTEAGRDALGWYHEKKHDLGHGLGPEHDWASHGADAFGLMCVAYEEPRQIYMPQVDSSWVA